MEESTNEFDLTKFINKNRNYAKLVKANGAIIDKIRARIHGGARTPDPNFWKTLRKQELFLYGFFDYYGNVERVFDQFQVISCCFTFLPPNKILNLWNVKKTSIKEYHFENFYHRIYTFRETVLQLINFLYFLKINERAVNRENIFKVFTPTYEFYDEKIKNILIEIEALLSPMNDKRRKSVHYGKFSEFNLSVLKMYELSGRDIDKLHRLKGEENQAKYLAGNLMFQMFATHHKLLSIYKRLFRRICSHAYLIHQLYSEQGN